jgi:periplasmic nitrate reductase NapD
MDRPTDSNRRAFLGLGADARPTRRAGEWHISSIVVHMRPELQDGIAAQIGRLPGIETQSPPSSGKLIATIESRSTVEIMDRIAAIQGFPGVVAVNLIYHHWEADGDSGAAG